MICRSRPIRQLFAVITLLLPSVVAEAQTRSKAVIEDEENMRNLTVFIAAKGEADSGLFGAGILAGQIPGKLYIVTAKHILEDLKGKPLIVKFYKDRTEYDAAVVKFLPDEMDGDDIAVISVTGKELPRGVAFARAASARIDYDVYTVGHPNHRIWEVSGKPAAVTGTPAGFVDFQSVMVYPGNSGGPLIANNLRFLVGMIVQDRPPQARAIDIAYILSKLNAWHIPCGIKIFSDELMGLK
jgi:S1-C subfamily serine protease